MIKEKFALLFAAFFHWKAGNRRKYNDAPYIVHPIEVVRILKSYKSDGEDIDTNMICAAYMHDLIEDTGVKKSWIRFFFGEDVANLVDELTDKTKLSDGKRAIRVQLNNARLSRVSDRAQTIKYGDILSNSRGIMESEDLDFASMYLQEKKDCLMAMTWGITNIRLYALERVNTRMKDLELGKLLKQATAKPKFPQNRIR